ncbi:MAG TPA: energy transducer TonB [Thermoanaerobaculia bacterium]|jgi:protein TonB
MATGIAGRSSVALLALLAAGCEEPRAAPPPEAVRTERVMVPAPPPPPAPPDPGPPAVYPTWTEPPRPGPNEPDPNPAVRPRLIESVEPEYTPVARTAGIQGIVILQLIIERDGRVSGGKVLKPLPFGLSQKAIDAVQHWRYTPAKNELGNPVRSSQNVTVHFRL